jgi:DNA repair exonuclease SbcCD nuclease subunit
MNSWLYEQTKIIEQIFEYAKENDVRNIIFGGDLFEEKNRIPVTLYNYVWELFNMHSFIYNIYFNTGNHDIVTLNRTSSLRPFSKIVDVISSPTNIIIEDSLIRIIPYGMTEDNLSIPKFLIPIPKQNILILHEDIDGLIYGGSDNLSTSKIAAEYLQEWDFVFNGHIHKPQQYKNIVNVGSPMLQDWGEVGEEKRFIHFVNGEVKSIKLSHPNFITIEELTDTWKEIIEKDTRNFYRIDIFSEELNNPIFKQYNVFPNVIKSKKREVRIIESEDPTEELKSYIDILDTDLDKNELLKLGSSIIKEN